MTKLLPALLGAGLLVSLGAADARPLESPAAVELMLSGHTIAPVSTHFNIVRRAHHKKRAVKRARRAMRSPSMSGGRRTTTAIPGTSNVTTTAPNSASTGDGATGGANTGRNSAATPGARRRRVPPPGPLANDGQSAPQAGAGTTGGTP